MSRYISQTIQDSATVSMEGKQETAHNLSNGTSFNDLEWRLAQISKLRIIQRQITRKWYKIKL